MLSFKETLSEQKNTHMTHIEDRVLYGGVNGTRQAIFALRDLRDMLGGKKEGKVSVKWDGAPAVFAGIDPNDGKFFVAKKGIFNKNPAKIIRLGFRFKRDIKTPPSSSLFFLKTTTKRPSIFLSTPLVS